MQGDLKREFLRPLPMITELEINLKRGIKRRSNNYKHTFEIPQEELALTILFKAFMNESTLIVFNTLILGIKLKICKDT